MAYTGIYTIRQKTYEGCGEVQERLLGVFVSHTKAMKALKELAMQFMDLHPDCKLECHKSWEDYYSFTHGKDGEWHTGLIIDHYNSNVIIEKPF